MNRGWRNGLIGVCWVLCALVAWADHPQPSSLNQPAVLVQSTTERMLAILKDRQSELDRQPGLIYELVNQVVVPQFDFERITQLAVGRYWANATPDQKTRLIAAFQRLLVRTYAKALLNYSGQKILFLPMRPGPDPAEVTVSTQVQSPGGGPPVPIHYRMAQREGAWKVVDVTIDGVSLVSNYRSSFAAEIRQGGLDGLIASIEQRLSKG
ncbi:phospholipid transport system substrate-binding protein [Gammaproteobacteria bacterium]